MRSDPWPAPCSKFALLLPEDSKDCAAATIGARFSKPLKGQPVGAFVHGVTGVPSHPMPGHLVARQRGVELLPQIDIFDRPAVCSSPVVASPGADPFRDTRAQVLAVGIKIDRARSLQDIEGFDGGREFHAIVGRMGLAAFEFSLVAIPDQNGTPAPRAGISRTGPIGMDDYA